MVLPDLVEIVVLGVLVSSFYALLAVGLTMVYAIAGIENLAHGSYVMVGAYFSFIAVSLLGAPPLVGAIAAVIAGVAAAVITWKGIVEHIMDNPIAVFMVTLILALAVEQLFIIVFGKEPKLFTPLLVGNVTLIGTTVTWNLVIAFVASWACLAGLGLVLKYTYLGRSIVAVSQNRRAAELTGVDTNQVYLVVWILSGAFAGLVGVFYGYYTSFDPHMWVFPLIYSFSIVIVGGLGSLKGTIGAAYVIGFLEMTTVQIDPRYKGVPALLALIIIMMVRPQGLFGREELGG